MTSTAKAVTRAQTTADTIRQMIVDGELRPGDRLQIQMLADRLGVSRTPVNDALGALHKEGLLEYGAHRGYGVKKFDLGHLMDAFDVRLTLEGLGCRLIAERGLKQETGLAIQKNLQETETVLFGSSWSRFDQEKWRILNLQFHDLLLEEASNAYLTAGVNNARSLPPLFDGKMHRIPESEIWPRLQRGFSQQAFRDHVRIIEAVESRQATRAENMMKEHIFSSREKMRRIIDNLQRAPSV